MSSRKKHQKKGAAYQVTKLLLKMMYGVIRFIDIRLIALIGRGIGYLVWAAIPSRRRVVARNIRIAVDPTLRGSELSSLVRQNIVRTCENMVCTFKTGLLSDKELDRAVSLVEDPCFIERAEAGDCIICCVPHAGNWEMMARLRPLFPKVARFGSLYRRLDNPALEEAVYNIRTHFGCEMFNIKDGLKEIFRLARDGGMLGVLSDQFTQQGVFVPYFGKVTGTTPLPGLIYKRRKENIHMYIVSSRTTGLGQWEADFSNKVDVSDTSGSNAAISLAVNQALEKAQRKGILDGFWMHHRWKPSYRFAPDTSEETNEIIRQHARLPFRIILCVPEAFEEAVLVIPMMRRLQACRADMQLTVVCPTAQQAFWQTQPYITYVVTTDGCTPPDVQLEAEELYKDGPYDYLFMLSGNARVFKRLRKLMPMYVSGMGTNPLASGFRTRHFMPVGGPPVHKSEEYQTLTDEHIDSTRLPYADAASGNAESTGLYIAPFSTLGKADSWQTEKWKELAERLPEKPTLLAFEQDKEAALSLAAELDIPCTCVKPDTLASLLGPGCRLYAVDGLLPQLAALAGCPCHVIMSSRLAAAYAPLGEGHHVVSNHTPCHPCYRSKCDQQSPCHAGISVDDLLG
jgi:KDO2-lipid IV(A) lauroyltransferase